MATFFGPQRGHCREVQLYKKWYRFGSQGGTPLYLLSTPPGYQYRGGQTEWHFPFICVNRQQIRDKPEYAISEFQ